MDNASKETTPFNQIFGGYIRQDVTCLRCKYVSTTFQHFMDLLLDIRQVSTIEDALQQHFRQERIGGHGENPDSMYKCEKCHIKVPAKKRCLIERPPAVLCIQLKRFSLMGGKISKPVQLSPLLNMTQFVNPGSCNGAEFQYKLVSMITHVGPSPNCGHYTAIGEAAGGQFFQFDDSAVRPISVNQAMNTASYVVMYEMTKPSWERRLNATGSSANTVASSRATSTATSATANGHGKVSQTSQAQPTIPQISIKPKIISISAPVANRIGVVAATLKKTVASVATSVAGSSLATVKKTGLVPYDDDSDSESSASAGKLKTFGAPSLPKPTRPVVSSPFVPRAVTVNAIKREQEQSKPAPAPSLPLPVPALSADNQLQQLPSSSLAASASAAEVLKSASGQWTVTDVDHDHNPSVASDGSCGSTSGTWTVTSTVGTPVKRLNGESVRSTSPWTVMPLNKNGSVAGDVDAERKKVVSVNEASSSAPEVPVQAAAINTKLVREPFVPPSLSTARKRGSVDDSDNDEYDAELDRGRTKKVRKVITAPSSSPSDRGNPFQSVQSHQYEKRNGGGGHFEGHHNRSWSSHHRDQSRDRRFDDRGRRNSFGGTDFRDSYHHHHHHGGGGGGDRHNHHRPKHSFHRSFSDGRRNDSSFEARNGFRSGRR